MPTRKVVIFLGTLIFLLIGSGHGLFSIPHVSAAPPIHIALGTQTPTPKYTPSNGQPTFSATAIPTALQFGFLNYKVQAGDSVFLIAQKMYGGDSSKYSLILSANKINETTRLPEGMILKIPLLPTPTATFTPLPSSTATVAVPSVTPTWAPSPTVMVRSTTDGLSDGEKKEIVAMLTTFASSTLIGSTLICGFFAFVVYSNSRRIARKQSMARRIRPPLVR